MPWSLVPPAEAMVNALELEARLTAAAVAAQSDGLRRSTGVIRDGQRAGSRTGYRRSEGYGDGAVGARRDTRSAVVGLGEVTGGCDRSQRRRPVRSSSEFSACAVVVVADGLPANVRLRSRDVTAGLAGGVTATEQRGGCAEPKLESPASADPREAVIPDWQRVDIDVATRRRAYRCRC